MLLLATLDTVTELRVLRTEWTEDRSPRSRSRDDNPELADWYDAETEADEAFPCRMGKFLLRRLTRILLAASLSASALEVCGWLDIGRR